MNNKQAYLQKLRHPRWQKKRLAILERDAFTCQSCGSTENSLHVHHKYYEYDKEPWEYNEKALITLCEGCHEVEEYYKNELQLLIKQLLVNGYSHIQLNQYMAGLQMPVAGYNCEERVRLAAFCAAVPGMLDIAKEKIDSNWKEFYAGINNKDD